MLREQQLAALECQRLEELVEEECKEAEDLRRLVDKFREIVSARNRHILKALRSVKATVPPEKSVHPERTEAEGRQAEAEENRREEEAEPEGQDAAAKRENANIVNINVDSPMDLTAAAAEAT